MFIQEYQSLIRECERNLVHTGDTSNESLISRLEAMLATVTEGIQLLSSSAVHMSEHSTLLQMSSNLSRCIRLMIYGCNDATVPPIYAILVKLVGLKYSLTLKQLNY